METNIYIYIYLFIYLSYLAQFSLEWEIFQKNSFRENQNIFYFQ